MHKLHILQKYKYDIVYLLYEDIIFVSKIVLCIFKENVIEETTWEDIIKIYRR